MIRVQLLVTVEIEEDDETVIDDPFALIHDTLMDCTPESVEDDEGNVVSLAWRVGKLKEPARG